MEDVVRGVDRSSSAKGPSMRRPPILLALLRAALRTTLLAAVLLAPTAAPAQQISSVYTSTAVDACRQVEAHELGGTWACKGHGGWTVRLSEFDLRQTLILARDGAELGPAPRISAFNHAHATLEWRVVREGSQWRPFALIQRWFVADPDYGPDIQRLYVFRLDGEAGLFCTAGIVPVAGNPDANADARALADGLLGTGEEVCRRRG
jgi:hypothetical protein